MKNIQILKTVSIISSVILFIGCMDDLDISPEDPNTFLVEDFYATPESYKEGLAGVYANLTLTGVDGPASTNITGLDAGTSQYGRGLWNLQELTTDEVVWSWENDDGLRGLNRNTWTADNVILRGFFGRVMTQVAFANEYLRQTETGVLDARGVDETLKSEILIYRAEARFLRALAYYHMMDIFGKAGFVTENDPVGAYQSPQYERADLFTYIESELLEISSTLKDPLQNEYARVDKAAAWMLLAKIYLNAEVYIDSDRYDDCLTYCEKIIAGGFALSPIYSNNFNADNHENSARNEIIFPVVSDGIVTQNYGPTTVMINAQVGSLEQNADYGVAGWAGGLRVPRQFSEVFLEDIFEIDDRNTLITEDRPIDITNVSNYGTGYIIAKWSNLTSTGQAGSATEIVDTDYPMFRLADVYLMYAELNVRKGIGSSSIAVGYINDLRSRSNNTNTISSGDLTLDFILKERLVELHWEGHRRQDLIRFQKYTGGVYNWSLKGDALNGTSISATRSLFPIPTASLAANPNLTQNEGY